jgi:hypothetical protein
MDFPPRSLPTLMPAYLAQLELPHTEHYDALLIQQLYGPYGVDQTSAPTWKVQALGGPVVATQHRALQPFSPPTLYPSHAQFDVELARNSQSAPASTTAVGPASPMGSLDRLRKRKAATLRADDWEPYKKRILDLHIKQKKPLPKVRQTIEKEYGFKAEYVASLRARPCESSA